jgi:hypothetical protein
MKVITVYRFIISKQLSVFDRNTVEPLTGHTDSAATPALPTKSQKNRTSLLTEFTKFDIVLVALHNIIFIRQYNSKG